MKKSFASVSLLLALANTMTASAAPPPPALQGSDTLEEVATDLITSNCRGSATATFGNINALLKYIGGGSGTAGAALAQAATANCASEAAAVNINSVNPGAVPCTQAPTVCAQTDGHCKFEQCCRQVAGPMSRAINASECTTAGNPASAEGVLLGLDGIVIVTSSTSSSTCGGGHGAHATNVPQSGNFSDMPTDTTTWKNVLKTLYTGSGAGACNSPARAAVVNAYAQLFEGGCTPAACPDGIKHAYRRGDLSGTTDTFLSLIGAPGVVRASDGTVASTPFCNGKEGEDLDPVRRQCDSTEQVCEYDGKLGFVLPIVPPPVPTSAGTPAPSPDDVTILYNATGLAADNPTFGVGGKTVRGTACPGAPDPQKIDPTGTLPVAGTGIVGWNLPAGVTFQNTPRCDCRFPTPADYAAVVGGGPYPPNPAFTWNKRVGGACFSGFKTTGTATRYGLLQGDNGGATPSDNAPTNWGNRRPGTQFLGFTPALNGLRCCAVGSTVTRMDPRLENLALRNPTNAQGRLLGAEGNGPLELKWSTITAFYRIHSTSAGQSCVNPSAATLLADAQVRCQQFDATRQIGCLVQDPFICHVGFAGREAADSILSPAITLGEPLSVGGVDPTVASIQNLVSGAGPAYPLSRKLYYNSIVGFGNGRLTDPAGPATTYEEAQYNLYKCIADQGQGGGAPRNLVPAGPGANPSFATKQALARAGFVEVPAVGALPVGPKLCENMCTTNTSCTTLTAIPAGDLNEL
jgi:hypothetical protein